MPKIPLAVVSTSSDESAGSDDDLATDFRETNWTVVNMASIESFPFSEVSHQPYGMESTFLDSVSHGSANLRTRDSASAAQDMVSTSVRVSPRSPRPLFPPGQQGHLHTQMSLNIPHPRSGFNANTGGAAPAMKKKKSGGDGGGGGSPAASPLGPGPTLRTGKHATDASVNFGIPGAPQMSHRGRKAKPKSRRTRSLQVGAPRWRDSDGDMALLVRREVSKNGPVSPLETTDDAALPSDESSSSAVLTPPPLWVEGSSTGKMNEKKEPEADSGKGTPGKPVATAKAPKTETSKLKATTGASVSDSAPQSVDSKSKKCVSQSTTTAAHNQPQNLKTSSPNGGGGLSVALVAAAQRQPLGHPTAPNKKKTGADGLAPPPPRPAPPVLSAASNGKTTSPPSNKEKGKVPVKATTVTSSSSGGPAQASSGDGGETADAQRSPSRSPPTRYAKPRHSTEFSEGGGGRNGAERRSSGSAMNRWGDRSCEAILPAVSPSPSCAVAAAATSGPASGSATKPATATTTASTTTSPKVTVAQKAIVSDEHAETGRPEQRRRSGRHRRSSLRSTATDASEPVDSSAETVVVKSNARHLALKALVVSPDDSDSLRLPRAQASRSPDSVRHSLPALSPQQLSTATSAESPLHHPRRAKSVAPSEEVTPVRRASHPALSSDLRTATKPGSMHTLSTLLADSPPTLRPQTREFNEKVDHAGGGQTPSFVSPANRATAERLVTFVRAVSDPEVLHVIHDYLVEQQRTTPRYRLAATACEELLARKEELLQTQPSETGWNNANTNANDDGTRRNGVFTHATGEEGEPFTIEVRQPAAAQERSRAAELRRLLAEIAAEQQQEEPEQAEDPDTDEFDDFNFFDTPYPAQGHFSFGQPTVSGVVSRVFTEGMLFKIKTANGEYFFYNDTLQDVMMVRVQCVLHGNEKVNERAMLAPVEGTGETEITIAVLPEETNFFMSGVSHLPHFMAKRVAVPPDYVSPSVTQSLRKINGEINEVRKALGKWSRASDQSAFLKCCLKNHLKFTDLTFRPCAESLFRPDCDAVSIPPVTWRRPEEYVYLPEVSQTRLFRGEISCFLVKQGELNNHTVVAAMAAVAQFPDHVRWMFRHPVSAHVGKMERAEGCYRVTLLHNGWWKTYLIDDYVPASQKGPLFASCAEDPRRLWVPLLEKAYAKCLGSYSATCVVDAMEAMGDFTGFPVRYLDGPWAAAKAAPTGAASHNLFNYVNRAVRAGCTVLLFTPAESDAQAKNTVNLSTKRSSRLLPVKGVLPQFLPGHIYFLRDVAFYEELDLRMAQLKNPWTWETRNKMHREKKWKYTTWYDRPDVSVSAMGSVVGSSTAASTAPSRGHLSAAAVAAAKVEMSAEERQANDRKGTMWVEWAELLAAFAGGGACYTFWNHHRYRAKNTFVNGRPRFVLEMKTRRKVDVFVTLSLETVSETLDNYGTVVAARPTPLYGTALSVVQRLPKHSARVASESCEDVECVAARRTYVVAKDVSMKLTIDPRVADGTVLVVPLLDPQAAEDMAAARAAGGGSNAHNSSNSSGGIYNNTGGGNAQNQSEVHFVLSVVSDAVAGDGEDLSISFVSMRRSCGVFTDSTAPFDLESTSRVTTSYQICTEKGVKTLEGNRVCDSESTLQPPS